MELIACSIALYVIIKICTCASNEMTLILTGDISLDGPIRFNADNRNCSYADAFQPIKSELVADHVIANLESPVSKHASSCSKKDTLKGKNILNLGDARGLEALTASGIGIVGLANNHFGDFGERANFDTIDALKEANIRYVGVAERKEPSRSSNEKPLKQKPLILSKNGINVALLAYVLHKKDLFDPMSSKWNIKPALYTRETVRKDVEVLKKNESIHAVIVMAHWDQEYSTMPMEDEEPHNAWYAI